MPKRSPSFKISRAEFSIPSEEDFAVRSMGTWPTEEKNHFCMRPTNPGVLKYSALAMNLICRGHLSGKKKESITDWWLEATIAGPDAGIFSTPSIHGRFQSCNAGPKSMCLKAQYHRLFIAMAHRPFLALFFAVYCAVSVNLRTFTIRKLLHAPNQPRQSFLLVILKQKPCAWLRRDLQCRRYCPAF